MPSAESILDSHNLNRTACRLEVLNILISHGVGMSESSIRRQLSAPYDRITLYRTLKTFVEQGVLHTIALDGHDMRYALSTDDPSQATPHAHFRCTHCTKVFCIDGVAFDTPPLPEGYRASYSELTVNGVCSVCS